MKTRDEVENLKRNWLTDPCWDIEDTRGFEDYYFELSVFHTRQCRKWREAQVTKDNETRNGWYSSFERWFEDKDWLFVNHRSYRAGEFYETYLTPTGLEVSIKVTDGQIKEVNNYIVSVRE